MKESLQSEEGGYPLLRSCFYRGSAGFTLVEIMITVAIIGILAAIAIPQYVKYTKRARTAEAMSHVNMIYAALADWYSNPDLGNGLFLSATTEHDNTVGSRTFAHHFPAEAQWLNNGDLNYEYAFSSTTALSGGTVPLVTATARRAGAVFGVTIQTLGGGEATIASISANY